MCMEEPVCGAKIFDCFLLFCTTLLTGQIRMHNLCGHSFTAIFTAIFSTGAVAAGVLETLPLRLAVVIE